MDSWVPELRPGSTAMRKMHMFLPQGGDAPANSMVIERLGWKMSTLIEDRADRSGQTPHQIMVFD